VARQSVARREVAHGPALDPSSSTGMRTTMEPTSDSPFPTSGATSGGAGGTSSSGSSGSGFGSSGTTSGLGSSGLSGSAGMGSSYQDSGAEGTVRRMAQKAHEAVDRLEQTLDSGSERVMDWQQEYGDLAREQVRSNPLAAMGVAFAVGLVFSKLFMR
jgi:ElaB/YqjD/DUF883 family membrane-anchored ribosome-binding protein